jgi:hypothetical protein
MKIVGLLMVVLIAACTGSNGAACHANAPISGGSAPFGGHNAPFGTCR